MRLANHQPVTTGFSGADKVVVDVVATGPDIRPSSTDDTRSGVCGFAITPTFGRELRLTS